MVFTLNRHIFQLLMCGVNSSMVDVLRHLDKYQLKNLMDYCTYIYMFYHEIKFENSKFIVY